MQHNDARRLDDAHDRDELAAVHYHERRTLEQLGAELEQLDTFDVWEWRAGLAWRRVLVAVDEPTANGALARLEPGTSRASVAAVLELNPNHSDAHELAELADAIAGPIHDNTPRRRHTR